MTEKRHYEKPALRMTALQQQLLTMSGEIPGYQKSNNGFSQENES